MATTVWIVSVAAAAAGLLVGWLVGRRGRVPASPPAGSEDRLAPLQAQLAALEARLMRERAEAKVAAQLQLEQATQAQAAEIADLQRRLVEAYDALEALRHPPSDTQPDFAPTMPMRDL